MKNKDMCRGCGADVWTGDDEDKSGEVCGSCKKTMCDECLAKPCSAEAPHAEYESNKATFPSDEQLRAAGWVKASEQKAVG